MVRTCLYTFWMLPYIYSFALYFRRRKAAHHDQRVGGEDQRVPQKPKLKPHYRHFLRGLQRQRIRQTLTFKEQSSLSLNFYSFFCVFVFFEWIMSFMPSYKKVYKRFDLRESFQMFGYYDRWARHLAQTQEWCWCRWYVAIRHFVSEYRKYNDLLLQMHRGGIQL